MRGGIKLKIKTKQNITYALVDFATHRQETKHLLPAGAILEADFIDDEFICKLNDSMEKDYFESYKGYYYADVVANGICDYKNWYILDHDNWLFTFKEEEIEVV